MLGGQLSTQIQGKLAPSRTLVPAAFGTKDGELIHIQQRESWNTSQNQFSDGCYGHHILV